MGLDEGVDLVVGKHDVDALALEARVHPVVIPPGIEQVTGCLAFHALDLDEAGVAARVVGMFTQFPSDFPSFFEILRNVRADILHAFLIRSLAGTFTVAERRPVVGVLVNQQTAGSRYVLHENAVIEPTGFRDVGDLDGLAKTDICVPRLTSGRKAVRAGE